MKIFSTFLLISCSFYSSQAYFLPKKWTNRLSKYNGDENINCFYYSKLFLWYLYHYCNVSPFSELASCEYYVTSEKTFRNEILPPAENKSDIATAKSIKLFTLSSQPFKFILILDSLSELKCKPLNIKCAREIYLCFLRGHCIYAYSIRK